MDDAIGWIVALGLTFFTFRYFFGSANEESGRTNRDSPRHTITQAQIDSLTSLFPNIPEASIRYELERTGDADALVERALRNGGLPEPPRGFFPADNTRPVQTNPGHASPHLSAPGTPNATFTSATNSPRLGDSTSLIKKFGLNGRHEPEDTSSSTAGWATSVEERERRLRIRKETMLLEARRKLLAQQRSKEKGKQPAHLLE